ncbi:MAG: type VII toxin-antitoxin system MntA family adenylyltransferase antitoxin [Candidatus Bathyarchaeia archaeon]
MGLNREKLSERLSLSFSKYGEVDAAYLFGSRARGDFTEESDLDFAILLSRNFNDPYDLVRLIHDLAVALGVKDEKINLVVLNDASLELAYKVISEGIIIYERNVEKRVDFEVNTLKFYLDFKPVLDQMHKLLIEEYMHGKA